MKRVAEIGFQVVEETNTFAINHVTRDTAEKFIKTMEIMETHDNENCAALVDRTEAAEFAIQELMKQNEEDSKFRDQHYYYPLLNFVDWLGQIKQIKESFNLIPAASAKTIREFNSSSNDLNLAISIATN